MAVHVSSADSPLMGSAENWRRGLPVLQNGKVTVRELRSTDAASLLANLSNKEVCRYIAGPPASIEEFRRFIRWTHKQRRQGTHLCFGLVPSGTAAAVGIIQLWPVEPDFSTSEWGFVVGPAYWGTGLFESAARLLIDFAFAGLGATRLEARSVDTNDRGNGALRKLGAKPEGTLRRGFRRANTFMDHVMWSILAEDWAKISKNRQPS